MLTSTVSRVPQQQQRSSKAPSAAVRSPRRLLASWPRSLTPLAHRRRAAARRHAASPKPRRRARRRVRLAWREPAASALRRPLTRPLPPFLPPPPSHQRRSLQGPWTGAFASVAAPSAPLFVDPSGVVHPAPRSASKVAPSTPRERLAAALAAAALERSGRASWKHEEEVEEEGEKEASSRATASAPGLRRAGAAPRRAAGAQQQQPRARVQQPAPRALSH